MKLTIDLGKRPCISVMEASQLLGLSQTSIKRRIASGSLKALDRDNEHKKILILTKSIMKFLEEGDVA